MTSLLWLLPAGVPLLLSVALALRSLRPTVLLLAPLAALPALVLAIILRPGEIVEIPLMLGTRLGVTEATQVFLLFSAGLWLLAGLYARAYLRGDPGAHRFFGFFLATMAGNLGLVIARDVVSFYLFFILMSFAAYGMIVHDGTPRALRAGRIYVIFAVIGEAFLLPAMILVSVAARAYRLEEVPAAVAESPLQGLIIFLVFCGFGTKAGAVLLHFSLPVAYPAASPPAGAALGGPMIKAGLLGWLGFLPAGEPASTFWATFIIVAGLAAAFYGVVVGLFQQAPGAMLAYSSISQMGWISVALGAGLLSPNAWPLALSAVLVYAGHHAVAKGSLFLGLGVARRAQGVTAQRLALAGLALGAFAIAGAPLTTGAVAKYALRGITGSAPAAWPAVIETLLQVGAVGTTLLMGRFLLTVRPGTETSKLSPALWTPWAAQLALIAFGILALPGALAALGRTLSFSTLWPVTLGVLLVGALWLSRRRTNLSMPRLPEGDVMIPLVRALTPAARSATRRPPPVLSWTAGEQGRNADRPDGGPLDEVESGLRYWTVAGTVFVALIIGFVLLVSVS